MKVTVVDYGVGNLGSIENMLKKLGFDYVIASQTESIKSASKLILPGVGAFDAGMQQLNDSGLRLALDDAVLIRKVPVMGICLGMQLMTEGSEEGRLPGLGWIPARTTRFVPTSGEVLKVPHMGWNSVTPSKASRSLEYLNGVSRFYFVHSYYVKCNQYSDSLLTSQYGSINFDAAFERNNILGFQFHPEKSHRFGMAIFRSFLEKY